MGPYAAAGAARVTADLLSDIIPFGSRRIPSDYEVEGARIERLLASQAWTGAVLAMVELELPNWPDQPVGAHHADLAQAILGALDEARRITSPPGPSVPATPRDADPLRQTINYENLG